MLRCKITVACIWVCLHPSITCIQTVIRSSPSEVKVDEVVDASAEKWLVTEMIKHDFINFLLMFIIA